MEAGPMRIWAFWIVGAVMVVTVGGAALSLVWAQESSVPPVTSPEIPGKPSAAPMPNPTPWNTVQHQFYLSAKAGKEWLLRVNGPSGRFLPGLEPSLRSPIAEADQLHQAAAACTLACCATFFQQETACCRAG